MPENTHVVVTPEGLRFFKGGSAAREITVTLEGGGERREAVLPAGERVIDVPAGPQRPLTVVIRRRNLLQRLRHGARRLQIDSVAAPPRVLITGSGRSGTQTLARYLDGMRFTDGTPVRAEHEPLAEFVLPALLARDHDTVRAIQCGLGHNVESAPYYAIYPEVIVADLTLHVIRDGRRVVQSGLNRGWYQNDSLWNRIKPRFDGDVFASACQLWRLTNENALARAAASFRLEDLVADAGARDEFCRQAGVEPDGRDLPHSNRGDRSSEPQGWTPEQEAAFREICGPLMDRFYPGWAGA